MTRSNPSRIASVVGIALIALGAFGAGSPASASDRKRSNYETLENGPYYMRLERIVVPKIHENTVQKLLTYILVVEFADAESREKAKLVMPKLVDAYMRDLHILTSRSGVAEDGPDLAVAKRYLLASGIRILGADAIKDVFVERTIVRKAG